VTILLGFIEKLLACKAVVGVTRVAAGVMLLPLLLGLLPLVTTRFCRFAALVVAAAAVAARALRYLGINVGQAGG
jgi:hypothetical protein